LYVTNFVFILSYGNTGVFVVFLNTFQRVLALYDVKLRDHGHGKRGHFEWKQYL
jgi:hypothetical protein